jgi:hypothetical protein
MPFIVNIKFNHSHLKLNDNNYPNYIIMEKMHLNFKIQTYCIEEIYYSF